MRQSRSIKVSSGKLPAIAAVKVRINAALVIERPSDPRRRLAVFEFYAKAVRREGFKPPADLGQAFLYLPTPLDSSP